MVVLRFFISEIVSNLLIEFKIRLLFYLANKQAKKLKKKMPVSNDTPKSDTCVLKAKNMQLVKSNSLSETPFSTTPLMQQNDNLDELSGSLLKWTDYLKGYQKRWFILNNGTLYYYRFSFFFLIIIYFDCFD